MFSLHREADPSPSVSLVSSWDVLFLKSRPVLPHYAPPVSPSTCVSADSPVGNSKPMGPQIAGRGRGEAAVLPET